MIHQALLSFNGGELSEYLAYRSDFSKHATSAALMRNFLPMPFGGIAKRPGLDPLAVVVACDAQSFAIPFTASDATQYVLHFTPGVLKVYRKNGTVAATLAFLPDYTWPAFSWESAIRTMQFAVLNDVMFLCHPDFFPLRLTSASDTSWTLEFVPFDRAPMLDENLDPALTFSVASDPIAATWASGASYAAAAKVFTNCEWFCKVVHTASAINKPGAGANWRDYWRRMFYLPGDPVTLICDDRSEVVWKRGDYAAYSKGQVRTNGAQFYIATANHTSSADTFEAVEEFAYVLSYQRIFMNWHGLDMWPSDNAPSVSWDIEIGEWIARAGVLYQAIAATASPTVGVHAPGTGSSWATYWVVVSGYTVTPPQYDVGEVDGDIDVWVRLIPGGYVLNERVSNGGRVFVCILAHTSAANKEPGVGASWATYWTEVSRMIPSFALDDTTPGQYFRLAPERDERDFQVEISLLSGRDGTFSGPIVVEGGWNVFTFGDWHGILKVQRSYDKGVSWETIQTFQSSADNAVAGTGEEKTPVMMRLGFVKDATTAASGTMRAVLLPESQSVTGFVLMTDYVSAAQMTGTASTAIISGSTYHWSEGAFAVKYGFPRAVTLHERRLIFAATTHNPVSLWFSRIDDYMNFQTGVLDDSGIFITLANSSQSPVRWLASARRLFLGTALGEWVAGSETDDLPMTFGNLQIRQYSTKGSCHHLPLLTPDGVYFLGRNGARLYELTASAGQGPSTFAAEDHSRLAEHLTAPGVSNLAFQQTREPCLWAVTRAGLLLSFHHSREEQQSAWAQHATTGGNFLDVVVFPSDDGDDEVFFIVDRGATTHLERFAQGWQTVQESGTVGSYVDGVDEEPIVSELKFLPVDVQVDGGTTHCRRKRAHEIRLSIFKSFGGGIAYDGETQNFEYGDTLDLMDTVPPLESGWKAITLSPGYVTDLQPSIVHSAPYPFTVRAVVMRWEIHEG